MGDFIVLRKELTIGFIVAGLAAALWQGEITFGGVIAFIFADLLAFPLVMIYQKYYGNRLALRLSVIFWFVMSLSGLITEGTFSLLSAIPAHHVGQMFKVHLGWNLTSGSNALGVIVLGTVYWLYKTKGSTEMSNEFAQDVVCKMQVRITDAPAKTEHEGNMYYFCMPGCKESFLADPKKYL